jgi:uncharacterized protein (DUF1919 family)
MPTYEGLRLKILKFKRVRFAEQRRKKLTQTDFTIISNNCWGGMIYESYNLPKESPTVGLFFMASDYIRFLDHLKEYLTNAKLTFINPQDSRWKKDVESDKRFGHYPIGVLKLDEKDSGVEIFFLHYKDEQQAREKWQRRCKRVNYDKLLVKFNDQNGCTEEDVEKFAQLPYKNKLFFTIRGVCRKYSNSCLRVVVVTQILEKRFITASHEPFGKTRYLDVTKELNLLG